MGKEFHSLIEDQIHRLNAISESSLLNQQVAFRFRGFLEKTAYSVLSSTLSFMMAREMEQENPLAVINPTLLTREQTETAWKILNEKFRQGTAVLPGPAETILLQQLTNRTDAAIEMFRIISSHRDAISRSLFRGEKVTSIEDVQFGAGDTHRNGRTVCILTTNAGKLVYKPRNMHGDAAFHELAVRYFNELFRIPAALVLEEGAGVCEFVEKQHAAGEAQARTFYHNLGALAAFFKALGSMDMHVENISCDGTLPVVTDLETILSPKAHWNAPCDLWPEMIKTQEDSLYYVTILPGPDSNEFELSSLFNITEKGCAPFADGSYRNVTSYTEPFLEGYREGYRRCMKWRDPILEALRQAAPYLEVRVLLANSQSYVNVRKKLFHYYSLDTFEHMKETRDSLIRGLDLENQTDSDSVIHENIADQLYRGDVAYFYTRGDSCSLMADGKVLEEGSFSLSPVQRAIQRFEHLNMEDEAFDEKFLLRCIRQYPVKLSEEEQIPIPLPVLSPEILDPETAVKEAEGLFRRLMQLALITPDGKCFFGQRSSKGTGFLFCSPYFAEGISGIGLFAAAVCAVCSDSEIRSEAHRFLEDILKDLESFVNLYTDEKSPFASKFDPGEYHGAGGIMTALALIRRYTPEYGCVSRMQENTLKMLRKMDFRECEKTDRISGLSSLLSVMCRFPEYQKETETIHHISRQLLRLQTLPWKEVKLWKTMKDVSRALSGAGHGMAGIAQALCAAWSITGEAAYLKSAMEALSYEEDTWSPESGTWPDLRQYPPKGYMHGYCSGAPGIGIMVRKMQEEGLDKEPVLKKLEKLAEEAVIKLPLRDRDYLCCGNSTIAEYFITMGDQQTAGRVLLAMKKRKEASGNYCYFSLPYQNSETPSLLYGTCGIGYEMLRYARPDRILSIF